MKSPRPSFTPRPAGEGVWEGEWHQLQGLLLPQYITHVLWSPLLLTPYSPRKPHPLQTPAHPPLAAEAVHRLEERRSCLREQMSPAAHQSTCMKDRGGGEGAGGGSKGVEGGGGEGVEGGGGEGVEGGGEGVEG